MSIRSKILLYFSLAIVPLLGFCLLSIFLVSKEYREEEFQQQQKENITSTIYSLSAFSQLDSGMLRSFGRRNVDAMLDEKLLVYDGRKQLIYSSLDDTRINTSEAILEQLSPNTQWVESKEGDYDVVGLYLEMDSKSYYGIFKALDESGYAKLQFLEKILLGTFVAISLLILIVTLVLSKRISAPIMDISQKIQQYRVGGKGDRIAISGKSVEVDALVSKFNELLEKIDLAFLFQKNATNHISHELKTPLAVLVSNLEKMERLTVDPELAEMLTDQKHMTMGLSEVINVLLEISKKDAGAGLAEQTMRVDELVFDLCEQVSSLYPDFLFSVEYGEGTEEAKNLIFTGSETLMKAAITNLLMNCIRYSHEGMARIRIENSGGRIQIQFINKGQVLSGKEIKSLFQPFFRGNNSRGVSGHGLGLAMVKKIVEIYQGDVIYEATEPDTNSFLLILPLR